MKEIYIEIHQECGDCGKAYKLKLDLEKNTLNSLKSWLTNYYPRGNMSCERCSLKKVE